MRQPLILQGRGAENLQKILIAASVAFPFASLLAALLFESWPAKRFLIFYLSPILSMTAIWAALKIRTYLEAPKLEYLVDGFVFILAMARFFVGDILPISGHMLFFSHTLLTVKANWYKALALLLLLETSYFKLMVWDDLKTWRNGLILGIVTGITFWIISHRNKKGKAQDLGSSEILKNPQVPK